MLKIDYLILVRLLFLTHVQGIYWYDDVAVYPFLTLLSIILVRITIFWLFTPLIKLDYTSISCFRIKKNPSYTTRKFNFSYNLNEEAVIELTDNNSLESQEAYSNIASRLSNKFSFEKYKNNFKLLNDKNFK